MLLERPTSQGSRNPPISGKFRVAWASGDDPFTAHNLFVFERAPQPLDEHVVAPCAPAIHADLAMALSSNSAVKSWLVNWLP